jgi:hypothetical protein
MKETEALKKYGGHKAIPLTLVMNLVFAGFFACKTQPIDIGKGADITWPSYHLARIRIADTDVIEDIDNDARAQNLVQKIRSDHLRFVSNIGPGFVWVIVTDQRWGTLKQQDYAIDDVLRADELTLHKRMVWGPDMKLPAGYHTYEGIVDQLKAIHRRYPDITALEIIGGTQQFQKDIYAMKLSAPAAGPAQTPRVLFSAAIHGHEIMGTEVTMGILRDLLEKYGEGDKKIIGYLRDLEIWFVPVINVDGYALATTRHPNWRKNARDNDGDGTWSDGDGVDLNRNFDFNFGAGGSADPESRFYRGPYPFSERETRDMADFVKKQKVLFSFTYHSAESRVYYPWSKKIGEQETFTPEDRLLTEMAKTIAGKIRCINEDYTYQPVRNTHEESYATNYYYAELGTIDFMIELGKYDHVYPEPVLGTIIRHNLPAAYYLLERARGPGLAGTVVDASTGRALSAEIQILPIDGGDDVKPRTNDPRTGRFYRALLPGTYDVVVKATGYPKQRIDNVVVPDGRWTELDFRMQK